MGTKEIYAQRIEDKLKQYAFDLESLKKSIERAGRGDMPEWLNALLEIRDRIDEVKFHTSYLRRKRNARIIHIAKLHIACLLDELENEMKVATRRFGRL